MTITPRNQTEIDALEWAIGGLIASGWDDEDTLMADHDDLDFVTAQSVASIIYELFHYEKGTPVILPDGPGGKWVANDLVYRIGTQLPQMEDGHIEDLMLGKSRRLAGANARRYSNLCEAFAARIKEMV